MKIWKKIIEKRIRSETSLSKNQFGYAWIIDNGPIILCKTTSREL